MPLLFIIGDFFGPVAHHHNHLSCKRIVWQANSIHVVRKKNLFNEMDAKKLSGKKIYFPLEKFRGQKGFVRAVIGAPFFKWTGFRLLLPPFSGKMSGFYFSRPSGNRFTAVISDVTFDRQRFPARCNWRRQFSEEKEGGLT